MPQRNGDPLPPIEDSQFDGDKQSTELEFPKCKHEFAFINPSELKCTKCGLGYTDTPSHLIEFINLYNRQ